MSRHYPLNTMPRFRAVEYCLTNDRAAWQRWKKLAGNMDTARNRGRVGKRHIKRRIVLSTLVLPYIQATQKSLRTGSETYWKEFRRARHACCLIAGIHLATARRKGRVQ